MKKRGTLRAGNLYAVVVLCLLASKGRLPLEVCAPCLCSFGAVFWVKMPSYIILAVGKGACAFSWSLYVLLVVGNEKNLPTWNDCRDEVKVFAVCVVVVIIIICIITIILMQSESSISVDRITECIQNSSNRKDSECRC